MTDVLVVGCVCLNPLSFAGVEICGAPRGQNVHDAMRCSRPRGHHGKHVACSWSIHKMADWEAGIAE
jgi:hypothetical protein